MHAAYTDRYFASPSDPQAVNDGRWSLDSVRRRDTYRSVGNSDRRLARIFSALSNPNRVKIYNEILRAEKASYDIGHRCLLSEVVRSLKIKSPTISHHVKELVDAGLITAEREGKFLVCRINGDTREMVVRLFG